MIYHGIDAAASGPAPVMPASLADHPRFLFTAGSIRPARGVEDLIRALPAVLAGDTARSLVIAGGVDPGGQSYAAHMRTLARALGVERHVVWAGRLTAPEMAWAFQHCTAFVMTSRAEACPNLALEAMSQGAPIVSTRQDPMPEFFGDVATYYPPRDAGELAARIAEAVSAPAGATARAQAGKARAATFTWRRTAEKTIEELQRAAGLTG
jgi:glycosyltransferase involved in cell wall biosynthesis